MYGITVHSASVSLAGSITRLLTNKLVKTLIPAMLDVAVIEEPAAAVVTLDPKRARLLSELVEPASAAALAARLGLPRQKVNYHLRAL